MKKFVALAVAFTLGLAAAQTQLSIGLFEPLNERVERVLPRFNELHPDIEVEVRTLGFDDHHNALVTALATGSGAADVVAVEIGYIARFVAEGGLLTSAKNPLALTRMKTFSWTTLGSRHTPPTTVRSPCPPTSPPA